MKLKILYILMFFAAVVLDIYAVGNSIFWLEDVSGIAILLLLFAYYSDKLSLKKVSFTGFLLAAMGANFTGIFGDQWFFAEITLGLWLTSFVFLIMEALKYTQYSRRNRYLHLYFLAVVAIYTYLFSLHMIEIEENLSNDILFSMYLIYYLNLLILGVIALIYYLNSFSRKAVFFSCLALAFILSDVLRDMSIFYFRDLSVEVVGGLIKFAALKLTFLFFATEEKKLSLLHLV